MKTANTLENKAKFFALYLGQKVFNNDNFIDTQGSDILLESQLLRYVQKNEYLGLRPLSQITDEDFIEIAKIFDFIIGNELRIKYDGYKIVMYSAYNDTPLETTTLYFYHKEFEFYSKDSDGKVVQYDSLRIQIVIDFLRSKGYALPWMDLSVEDLVSYGWIKLK